MLKWNHFDSTLIPIFVPNLVPKLVPNLVPRIVAKLVPRLIPKNAIELPPRIAKGRLNRAYWPGLLLLFPLISLGNRTIDESC